MLVLTLQARSLTITYHTLVCTVVLYTVLYIVLALYSWCVSSYSPSSLTHHYLSHTCLYCCTVHCTVVLYIVLLYYTLYCCTVHCTVVLYIVLALYSWCVSSYSPSSLTHHYLSHTCLYCLLHMFNLLNASVLLCWCLFSILMSTPGHA